MTTQMFTPADIAARQQTVRNDYRRSQRAITISGFRQLMGNTLIAVGTRLHGSFEPRREAAGSSLPTTTPLRGMV